jgi:LAO/AO transport system kinase
MAGRIVPAGWTSVNPAGGRNLAKMRISPVVADIRLQDLARRLLDGDRTALARLITRVEARDAALPEVMAALYERTGGAHVIGVTGPPGAGKSTLTDGLITHYRAAGKRVGVVAVDPSSPFSGGAILGDRVRMQRHSTDPGVFIRSMASRGASGGLARASWEAELVLDAMGCDVVLVETVGVGQIEIDIVDLAHSTVVVCLPGAGDEVQAIKAGLLEAADVLVVNKADLPGAEDAERWLHVLLHSAKAPAPGAWDLPLLRTVASRDEGIPLLVDALVAHRAHLERSGELARIEARRARRPFVERVRERLVARALEGLEEPEALRLFAEVERRSLDPYTAADRWVETRLAGRGGA